MSGSEPKYSVGQEVYWQVSATDKRRGVITGVHHSICTAICTPTGYQMYSGYFYWGTFSDERGVAESYIFPIDDDDDDEAFQRFKDKLKLDDISQPKEVEDVHT